MREVQIAPTPGVQMGGAQCSDPLSCSGTYDISGQQKK
jgi:hypothetical protein